MSRAIWACRRRRCASTCARSRPTSGARPDLPTSAGARGDQAAAPGELRAAPRERDPQGRERVFREGARPRPTEVSRVHRRASRPLRGRADLPDLGRVGVRLLPARHRRSGRARAVEDERLLGPDPRAARGQLLRLRLPADVEGAAAGPASRSARCRVERLMRANGIQGAKRRGKPWRTTTPGPGRAPAPGPGRARLHRRAARIGCGSPTSPTCAAGRAWCSSRSSSTPTQPARSSAGSSPATCAPRSSSTRCGWRSHQRAARRRRRARPPQRSRLAIHRDRLHPDPRRPRRPRLGRLRRRRLRQRAGRELRRQLQDRADRRPRLAHPLPARARRSSNTSAGSTRPPARSARRPPARRDSKPSTPRSPRPIHISQYEERKPTNPVSVKAGPAHGDPHRDSPRAHVEEMITPPNL